MWINIMGCVSDQTYRAKKKIGHKHSILLFPACGKSWDPISQLLCHEKMFPLQYISQETILQQTYFIRFVKEMKVNLHKYHYPWVFSLDHLEAYPLLLFNSFCTDSACPGWGYMGLLLSLEFCHFTWILGLTDPGLSYGHILLQPLSVCRNWVNIFILKVSHFARTLKLILVFCSKVIFSKAVIQYVSHKDTHQNLVSSSRKDKLE